MGGNGMNSHSTPAPHDHEMALKQHRQGMAPALKTLMRQIRRQYPGKVLDVRLERGPRGNAYVFTILHKTQVRQVRVPIGHGMLRNRTRSYNFNNRSRP